MTPASLTFRVVRRNDGGIQNICAFERFGLWATTATANRFIGSAHRRLASLSSRLRGRGRAAGVHPGCLPACLGPGAGGGRVRRVLDSPRSAAIPKFSRDPMRPVFLLLLLRPLHFRATNPVIHGRPIIDDSRSLSLSLSLSLSVRLSSRP